MHTNLNCKAVKVTEVIEKLNSKKSGRKNHRWRRPIKNIKGQMSEELLLTDQSSNTEELLFIKNTGSRMSEE